MEYQLNYPESQAVYAIAISLTGYYFYYYLITSEWMESVFKKNFQGDTFYLNRILANKLTGFIFLALIPGILFFTIWKMDWQSFGISFQKVAKNWYWLLGLPVIIFTINYFSAKKPDIYLRYPQMRIQKWSPGIYLLSTFGWILYLVSYEFLFRGILLLNCIEGFGIWPAIAINLAIYSAIHMTNGFKETIGAIPFGLIACLLVIQSDSILIPIVMHVSLSVSTEIFAIRNNPEMEFVKSRRL